MSPLVFTSARFAALRLPDPTGGVSPHAVVKVGSLIAAALIVAGVGIGRSAENVGLALLSLLAVAGLFYLYGTLAGYVRLDLSATAADVERAAADAATQAMEVVSAQGTRRFANLAAELLHDGRYPTLEMLIAAEADRGDTAYRLAAAAARGEVAVEDVFLPRLGQNRPAQWLRVRVMPLSPPLSAPDAEPMVLWTAVDVTADRDALQVARTQVADATAPHTAMPVGLCRIATDDQIQFANPALQSMVRSDTVRVLTDLMTADAAVRLRTALNATDGAGETMVSLDLLREDGVAVPVTAYCRAPSSPSDLATVVFVPVASTPTAAVDGGLQRVLDAAPFGVATIDHDGRVVTSNAAFLRLVPETAGPGQGILHRLAPQAAAEQRSAVEGAVLRALSGRVSAAPVDITTTGDTPSVRRVTINPLTAGPNPREAAIVFVVDASEQKALEQRYAQSEKMEAIGTFVAGIAHDFNNVLGAIIGSSEHLLQLRRENDRGHHEAIQIRSTALRAAEMVKQLMAFTRQQTLQPQILEMNDAVQELSAMLTMVLGARITLGHDLGRDLWTVKADRTQIDRVLVNLARNAKDAMPKGGSLTVRTRNITERASVALKGAGMPAGEYVLIEVEDTGSGMPPEVLAKLFQPFFTTKEVGKGTGLGLASVYGIIKQTGGFIYPDSTVGRGTTFRIFLPRYVPTDAEEKARADAVAAERVKRERPRDLTGTGRVLLVEDEDFLRAVTARQLRRLGYEVLEAITGAEALEVLDAEGGQVDLIISDVIMPEMDGPTMYREMLKSYPDLKIIFVSGYPSDAFDKGLEPSTTFTFVQKPYPGEVLAGKIKEVMAA